MILYFSSLFLSSFFLALSAFLDSEIPFFSLFIKRSNGGAVEAGGRGGGGETCVFAYSQHTLLLIRGR